jgi:eukaryotic-like serine/threonine-protein kinase
VGSDDGHLYALNTQTSDGTVAGTVGWQVATGSPVESGPATNSSSNSAYVGNNSGVIYEADGAADSPVVWKFQGRGAVQGTPVTDGFSTVYAGSADGFVYAVANSGPPLWSYRAGGAVRSGPALADQTLYIGSDDGHLHAIDVTTGLQSWSYPTSGKVRSQVLVSDGVIYFGSWDHRVYALRAQVG